ncbi:MAG: hypothetical protein LQ351_001765 [Letrouitia transgressa]|nr:MAG: hypothetical protein LQ351_001765 [Letrouitia transgressa]
MRHRVTLLNHYKIPLCPSKGYRSAWTTYIRLPYLKNPAIGSINSARPITSAAFVSPATSSANLSSQSSRSQGRVRPNPQPNDDSVYAEPLSRHGLSRKQTRRGSAEQSRSPRPRTTKPTAPAEKDTNKPARRPPGATVEEWQTQKAALAAKFKGADWSPRKRLSPDAVDGIRELHAQNPDLYTTPVLAQQFQISPEAVRRILKSRWKPSEEEQQRRRQRWEKRGQNIWNELAEQGMKPPKKWRIGGARRRRNPR